MMTIAILCGFLPTLILSPFAGVWADRYDKKKLIIISDTITAFATFILAMLFLSGITSIWLFFVVMAIRAVGAGIQTPAVGSFIPQFVPEEKLTKVNALNGSIQSITMFLSPVLSGALLAVTSVGTIFFIDVITAAIANITLLFFLKVKHRKRTVEEMAISYFTDMKAGLKYIKTHSYVKRFFLFCAFFFFIISPVAFLTPLQVTRSFGTEVWRLAAVEMTFTIGMALGGVVMAMWGGLKNRVYTMILASVIIAVGTVALGIIPVFWLYLGVMALIGLTVPIFSTPSTVLLQEKVEQKYLGRVFGVYGMISSSMMPLGMLFFGPVSDTVKIELLLISTGILLFFGSILALQSKVLVKAGEPDIAI